MTKIEFTEKEAYLLWSILCWFEKPVSSELKYKLYKLVNQKKIRGMDKKYQGEIITRIVALGTWISKNHPEWTEK